MEEKPMSNKFSLGVLATRLSEKTGLDETEAELFIKKMFEVANRSLQSDKLVKVKWLGTFKVTSVKDRESVDVNTGERIVIEGRDKISFTPDNILKEIVNKPFAQFETVVVNDGVEFDEIDRKFEAVVENEVAEVSDSPESPESLVAMDSPESLEAVEPQENIDTQESLGVINFLDEAQETPVSDEMIVIGEEKAEMESEEEQVVELAEELAEESEKKMVEEPEGNLFEKTEEELFEEPEEELFEEPETEPTEEPETEDMAAPTEVTARQPKRVVLSRSVVIAASVVFVALIGCIGWFAFNYGKMAAQRDQLALQLNSNQKGLAKKPLSEAKRQVPLKQVALTQEEVLRKKAKEDSMRMAQASEAIKTAENAEQNKMNHSGNQTKLLAEAKTENDTKKLVEAKKLAGAKKEAEIKKQAEVKKQAENKKQADKISDQAVSKYDQDARVRTGAYRIIGVAETVTAKDGQTIKSISQKYLGPGMECYVEALNGTSQLKSGQKVKIPKLELKKKK